ncbi:MAG: GNAT family N-acetyltransferase [Desulfobacteraceae bacterium]|uniref:GNAT family N-acetyltransferase n=1 Tax=Candidatus Desulfacyla euxinica TaxID=2841693 RepID=A0A8J6MZ32_9DELT|nr:GNAT family N-acetyltransferase [Candidatus Desulfacyla euxinica]MBL6979062.1 GNAT family N-acetyltransferase [Desulfobacteraceae bacterium]
MVNPIKIREYREGDEKQILNLRQTVFGDLDPVRLKKSTWLWQFRHNPAGEAFCALAEDHGIVVGQYTVIPTRFSVQGDETLFAFSCDTMIHPEYRKQGMFTALARKVYRLIESRHGINTVWGFPNEISLPGFTRSLNWKLLTVFPLRVIPLRPLAMFYPYLPFKKRFRQNQQGMDDSSSSEISNSGVRFPDVPGLLVEPITRFDAEFDKLWDRNRDIAPVIQVRNTAYLNWRYFGVSEFGYRAFAIRFDGTLSGYMVIRMMGLRGHFFGVLADLFPFPVRDRSMTRRLFLFARNYCKTQGAEFMTCLISRSDPSLFKEVGLRKIPAIFNPKKWYFGCRYPQNDRAVLGSPKNWYLTYGDTDIA